MNDLHETEVLDRLLAVVVLLETDMRESLAAQGLSVPRARVVWHLHHHGPSTQRALADALQVTPRNVTGLVDALVASGYVTREPHPVDRRALHVTLTERGARAMAAMDREHRELARQLLGGMPGYAAFAEGLAHVLARLEEALA